ncbi:MAG: hypothetical protein WDW38_000857 [Sanguina aurantia]
MESLQYAFDTKAHGLLEMPTGCGKTMALLCPALAWQQKRQKELDDAFDAAYMEYRKQEGQNQGCAPIHQRAPTIYYSSRTHAQLTQVVAQLQKTNYNPRMAVLGSRQQYCLNSDAMRSKDGVNDACADLLSAGEKKGKGCRYKNQDSVKKVDIEVHDIEELKAKCASENTCPFFVARTLAKDAELVLCPYNYILEQGIRTCMQIHLEGSIVIFDEAHNIEDTARDAGSLDQECLPLMIAMRGLSLASDWPGAPQEYAQLRAMLQPLLSRLKAYEDGQQDAELSFRQEVPRSRDDFTRTLSGQAMVSELGMMGLGQEAVAGMSGVYKRILLHEEGNRMLHPDHPERNAHKLAAAFKMTIQQILMDSGVWESLLQLKHYVGSESKASDFKESVDSYLEAVDSGGGGLMIAVHRGKLSEGIDFKDRHARGVLLVGIPLPAWGDPKGACNTSTAIPHGSGSGGGGSSGSSSDLPLNGNQWYELQAFRAVNQAVGRCIRHKLDFGAIVLMDERFSRAHNTCKLSKWVRGTPANSLQAARDALEDPIELCDSGDEIEDLPQARHTQNSNHTPGLFASSATRRPPITQGVAKTGGWGSDGFSAQLMPALNPSLQQAEEDGERMAPRQLEFQVFQEREMPSP